jgi:anthranilate synthase component 1
MLQPDLPTFLDHRGLETHAALCLTAVADGETPVTLYAALAASRPDTVLLESVEGGEALGRWSIIGYRAAETLDLFASHARLEHDGKEQLLPLPPLPALRAFAGRQKVWAPQSFPMQGGIVGWLGFETMATLEPVPLSPGASDATLGRWLRMDRICVIDHVQGRIHLIAVVPLRGNRARTWAQAERQLLATARRLQRQRPRTTVRLLPSATELAAARDQLPVQSSPDRATYLRAVATAKQALRDGELFQVVLSRRLTVAATLDPLALYRALRTVSPAPYLFLLRGEEQSLVGASPEMLVRLDDGLLRVRPIAGTRRRGRDATEDDALAADLLADQKELAEHRMLLDLGRNDLGRIAVPGSVRVERQERIERFSHVQHIVSDVTAKLRADLDPLDALQACFPAGTVSGAPKVRACQWISQLEGQPRGPYAGTLGYLDSQGRLDTCIAIRTMRVERHAVHVQAGAGIVLDSDPAAEADECEAKARAALTAVALAQWTTQQGAAPHARSPH